MSETPQRFSKDFGQFAKTAQAAMFWLGAGTDHLQLHNPEHDFPDADPDWYRDLLARPER